MSPALRELARVFARIGLLSFGGPAAQIGLLHQTCVDQKRWLTEREFLAAVNLCTLLPGPEATQLAACIGLRRAGTPGAILAATLFLLPGALLLLALSLAYRTYGSLPPVRGLILGLSAAVLGLIAQALWRVASRTLQTPAAVVLSLGSLIAIAVLAIPFPLVLLAAGTFGMSFPRLFPAHAPTGPAPARPSVARTLRTLALGTLIWLAPLAALSAALGPNHILVQQSVVFAKSALVTFGGAYSVLAYFRQQFVDLHAWLSPADMLVGLSLAETTPGPLILVGQFLAFTSAAASVSTPVGIAASALFLWTTFAPAITLVLALAPWSDWLASRPRLSAALSAITAAVVGVIAALALWLATHTLFAELSPRRLLALELPVWGSIRPAALLIALLAGVLLIRFKWGIARVLLLSALLGLLAQWLTAPPAPSALESSRQAPASRSAATASPARSP